MKETDRNAVFNTALFAVQQTAPMLCYWISPNNAANVVAQIYDFHDQGRVISEHYTLEQFAVNVELTVIAAPERVSVIGQGHAYSVRLPGGFILYDDLLEDVTNIAKIIQFALQFL